MYIRKTEDEWQIHGDHGFGWEELCAYTNRKEAREDIKLYRANQPGSYKLIKKRVKKNG